MHDIYGDKLILFTPIASGLYDFTEFLLNNGASATKKIEGDFPIEIAERYGQSKIIDLLIKYGAKRISKEKAIQSRFLQCAFEANLQCMQDSLQKGAEINGNDDHNNTALIEVLRMPVNKPHPLMPNRLLAINFLLEQGADPNLEGNSQTIEFAGIPLHVAIAMNSSTMKEKNSSAELVVRLLIDAGAYISGRDESFRTPLHIAVQQNNYKGAKILIDAGAKLMDRDKNGRTPLDYAESAEMIKLLKEHGATEQ